MGEFQYIVFIRQVKPYHEYIYKIFLYWEIFLL